LEGWRVGGKVKKWKDETKGKSGVIFVIAIFMLANIFNGEMAKW